MRGIYEAKDETTITRQMYFHCDYLNERSRKRFPRRADPGRCLRRRHRRRAGGRRASRAGDRRASSGTRSPRRSPKPRRRSPLGFVAHGRDDRRRRSRASRYVVILIIMAVAANTMAMTARERLARVRDAEGAGLQARLRSRALIMGEATRAWRAIGGADRHRRCTFPRRRRCFKTRPTVGRVRNDASTGAARRVLPAGCACGARRSALVAGIVSGDPARHA